MEPLALQQFAQLEDRHWWFRARRRVCMGLLRAHLQALAGENCAMRVLDLGAGVGGMLDPLAELAGELTYTDLSRQHIVPCRERGHERGVLARAEALPFHPGSFDLVSMFDVLEHVERDDGALAEVRRVLAPQGRLFLHVPAHPILYAENDRRSGHHRRYTRNGLRRRLESAGFQVERLTFTNALLFPLIAPTVLGLRLCERLGLAGGDYTNLSWSSPPLGSRLLEAAFAAELVLSRTHDLPLGHSLAAIARTDSQRVPDSGSTKAASSGS